MLAFYFSLIIASFAVFSGTGRAETVPTIASLVSANYPSLDDLIRALPLRMRQQFVLLTTSKSPQPATIENPRVILYDGDSDGHFLVIAASTMPDDESAEMIEFDPTSGKFRFRTIDFATSPATPSVENPMVCTACHTSSLRPNWNPYPSWPDAVANQFSVTAADLDIFQSKYLPRIKDPTTKRWSALSEASRLNPGDIITVQSSPAADLNQKLQNARQIYLRRKVEKSGLLNSNKWLVFAALSGCDSYVREKMIESNSLTEVTWKRIELTIDLEIAALPLATQAEFLSSPRGRSSAIASTALFGGIAKATWLGQNFQNGHLGDSTGVMTIETINTLDPDFSSRNCSNLP